ncbi:MAG: hypothetical protein J6T08_06470, partial [Lentisphaeria bacterium]|nr:hypothetical protein [Lentisphaeria bacterium]
ITDSTFTENSTSVTLANSNYLLGGGAIYFYGGTLNISGSTFTGNHADGANSSNNQFGGGGAIGIQSGTVNISGTNIFSENYTLLGHGGAIFNYAGTLNIDGATSFIENQSGRNSTNHIGHGGAVYVSYQDAANLTVTGGVLFQANQSISWGGALSVGDKSEIFIEGATFKDNSSGPNGNGSAIYNATSLTIINSTFTGNFCAKENATDAAVITNEGANGKIYVVNSTFLNNNNSDNSIVSSPTAYDLYNQNGKANVFYVINTIYDIGYDAKVVGYGNVKAVAGTNLDATAKTDGNQTYFLPTGGDTVIGGKAVTASGKTLTYNGTNIAISSLTTAHQALLADAVGKDQLGADRALGTTPYYSVGAVNGVPLTPENVTLKWTIGDYTYNGADQTVTVQVVNAEDDAIVHDTITVTLKYNDGTADFDVLHNAGSYTVTVDETALLAALGYHQTLVAVAEDLTKTVTVKQKTLNVTADNKEMFKDGVLPELTYTVKDGDLLDGDDAGFTGGLTTPADGTVEGDFAIEAGTLTVGNTNYIMNYTAGTITVVDANGVLDPSRLIVDTASDDPDAGNTLREALEYAADFGGDLTITFAADTFAANTKLTLNSELAISLNLEGTITIDGSYVDTDGNTGRITIDNTGKTFRVLSYADTDTTSAAGLTIKNLEILGGKTTAAMTGMGIYSRNVTLTLDHFRLANAVSKYGDGAGINHSGGDVSITDSEFYGNGHKNGNGYNANGGAIYLGSVGKLNINNTLFEANCIENKSGTTHGGAIYLNAATVVTINDSQFISNYTNGNGAAIYGGSGSVLNISNTLFENNVAGANGGALYTMKGYVNVSDSTFVENKAGTGGAISTWYSFNSSNSVFRDNHAYGTGSTLVKDSAGKELFTITHSGSGHGGAVHLYSPSGDKSNIYNTTFYGNSATGRGGALFIQSIG